MHFRPPGKKNDSVSLRRIDPDCEDGATLLGDVLLGFFATDPKQRQQMVVGWYGEATVHRTLRKWNRGHVGARERLYNAEADTSKAVLLPVSMRNHRLPSGKGGVGQSNVCYVYEVDGSPKRAPWLRRLVEYVSSYHGPNLLTQPMLKAMEVRAGENSPLDGQGYEVDPRVRKAVEAWAMKKAKRYFGSKGYTVDDFSKQRPYDLLCTKARGEMYVEVKGTQGPGDQIILSRGEIEHARKYERRTALYVLHSIKVDGKGNASGGKRVILKPWDVDKGTLTPMTYSYRLPRKVVGGQVGRRPALLIPTLGG